MASYTLSVLLWVAVTIVLVTVVLNWLTGSLINTATTQTGNLLNKWFNRMWSVVG